MSSDEVVVDTAANSSLVSPNNEPEQPPTAASSETSGSSPSSPAPDTSINAGGPNLDESSAPLLLQSSLGEAGGKTKGGKLIEEAPKDKVNNDAVKPAKKTGGGSGTTCGKSARMTTSLEDISSLRLWKAVAAECVGTFLLTFVGCGSCINLRDDPQINGTTVSSYNPVVRIALSFGLSVATIVWAICHVSGGHINPAVTAAMLATRKISLAKAVFYVIFQCIGAIVGAGLLYGLTPQDDRDTLGSTLVNSKLSAGQGVGVELFITFVLVLTVFASCDGRRKDLNGSAPLTIGLSVTMCHLFAIDYTGSSMNTARSFGPAVVMGTWANHWVYWVGPILGGVLAGLLYEHVFAVNASLAKVKACMLSSDYDDEKYKAQKVKVRIIEEDPEEAHVEDLPLSERDGKKEFDPSNA